MRMSALIALKYGPLVYNVEDQDNKSIDQKVGAAPLTTEWRPDLLGGVMVIKGQWSDGSEMIAIPNYARMNRVGPPHEYPGEPDSGPGTKAPSSQQNGEKSNRKASADSKVWI